MSKRGATSPLASRVRAYLRRRAWPSSTWFTVAQAARDLHAEPGEVKARLVEERAGGRAWNVRDRWYGRQVVGLDNW